jgi:Domain of unknown function (DUF3387)
VLLQKPDTFTTSNRFNCNYHKYFSNKHLIPAKDGKFTPAWGGQGHWLFQILTETIKQNASIDWTIKESVKAKLKVAVKRILRKYGYPPDMQLLVTDMVLKQAELIANELTSN